MTPPLRHQDREARRQALLAWVREVHPDIWALRDDIDRSMLRERLALSPEARWLESANLARLRGVARDAPASR